MDGRMQKHRMMRWMGCLFVALTLVASSGVQAASKCKAWYMYGCSAPDRFTFTQNCLFPTELAATQAYYAKQNANYCNNDTVHCFVVVTSCDEVTRECPYTQNGYSGVTGMPCFLWDTPKFTITLSGGTEVEPSNGSDKKTLPFIATVKDQSTGLPTTNPVTVKISLKVEDPKTGGHNHGTSTRPRGSIEGTKCVADDKCWEGLTDNGVVNFNFYPTDASGTHTITATCEGCSNTETKPVDVKVNGLETIPSSSFYTFIGETDKHSDNHYLTPAAASILWRIAVSYQNEQRFKLLNPFTMKYGVAPPVLHINDASLEWGGKFDLSGGWTGSHAEHKRGTVVDVRANNLDTAIPIENFKEFKSLVADFGAYALLESPSIGKRHFHLRLLNRKE